MRDFNAQILAQGDAIRELGKQGVLGVLQDIALGHGGFYQLKLGEVCPSYQWGVKREVLEQIMGGDKMPSNLVEAFRRAKADEAADTKRTHNEFTVFVSGYGDKKEVRVRLARPELAR